MPRLRKPPQQQRPSSAPTRLVQHRRKCLRHHINHTNENLDADTRIFTSEEIKIGFKDLLNGGLRSNNDPISRLDLTDKQRLALQAWENLRPLRRSTSTPFQLTPLFDIYDHIFFSGALSHRVDVVWTDSCPKPGQKAYTLDAPGPLHRATIFVKRPHHAGYDETSLTQRMKRELEQTLLGEMIHALFVVYECRCATCLLVENRAMNTGVSGSGGPNWRELGMKVQEVAGEMLGGEEGGGILVWGGGVGSMWRR